MWRLLDGVLLVTTVVAPWVFLVYAVSRFRDLLRLDRWVIALLAIGLWLFFAGLLSPLTETLVQAIFHSTPKPWFAAYVESVRAGEAPLWMPTLGTGLPALASPYVGYLTPPTALLLFFADLDQGVNALLLAHLVLAGVSAFLLGRSLGFRRGTALLLVIPVVWNPWVFRRLSTEVHVLYLFAYAWLPLVWALTIRFVRTRAWPDALAVGIPLAFMAVSMPTVFAHAVFALEVFLGLALITDVLRRRWAEARRLLIGSALALAAAFAAAAPEHLAAQELFSVTAGTRFERTWITGGWREQDFSTAEFVRLLLPNQLGARLVPLPYSVAHFGTPFSPGDIIVTLAAVAVAASFFPRFRGLRPLLWPQAALFLILANVATHGVLYRPVRWVDPLWGYAGNFPSLGALALLTIVVAFGAGVEVLATAAGAAVRRLRGHRLRASARLALLLAGAVLLVVESLWGVKNFFATPATDPDGRPDLRHTVSTMPLPDLRKLPHLDALAALTRDRALPTRIYCTGDRPVWPSPCFDYAVGRAKTEAVGSGELAWAMPRWQWNIFTERWSASDGTLDPVLTRLLQLASVEYVLHPRDLDLPLAARIPWDPNPGNFELYGRFLQSSIGGGLWTDAWDGQIRLHAFPGLPRAWVAPAVAVAGDEAASDAVVRTLLADPAFDLAGTALLQAAPGAPPPQAPAGDGSLVPVVRTPAEVLEKQKRPARAKLRVAQPRPGAWRIEGELLRPGALVLSQMYYPGMRATVNGRPAPVHRAQLFLTAVPVPAGEVRLTLAYQPLGLLAAGLVTGLFAVGLLLRVLRPRGRNLSGPP